MAEPTTRPLGGNDRLVAVAFGTYHAVTFIVLAVLILHLTGALVGLLGSLNTLTGLALFAALWATTTWSTARAFRGVPISALGTDTSIGAVIVRAVRSGALNGMLFLGAAVVILGLTALLTGQGPSILIFIYGALFFVPFSLLTSATVGAITGLLFAAIDLVHFWAVGRLWPQ
jgi:hypothetical protein